MALFTLQFVDSVSSSATLRLDLNDLTTWSVAEDTTFEAPRLRRAVASTMMFDGARVTASAYEPRKITLVLQLAALSMDNSATAIQNLARELDRTLNILKYKPNTTNPVYFRINRSDFTDVKFNEATRQARVELYADPFALGEQQTVSGTIAYDPAAVSNPQYLDVSTIKGDVATPILYSPDDAIAGMQSIISTWRRPTQTGVNDLSIYQHFIQAENAGLTLGTDTATQVVTGFSGGSGARVSFATSTALVTRISGNWPTTGAGTRGRFRVLARIKKNTAADVINFRFRLGASTTNIYTGSTVSASTSTTNIQMVDLGLFTNPYGTHPIYDGPSGTELGTTAAYWELQVQRSSGSGTVDIDYLLFLPADDQFAIISWGSTTGATLARFVWDGYTRTVYGKHSNGVVMNKTPASIVGSGGLFLSPGVTNRIWFIPEVTPGAAFTNSDTLATEIYYYPRYLYVRPVST